MKIKCECYCCKCEHGKSKKCSEDLIPISHSNIGNWCLEFKAKNENQNNT